MAEGGDISFENPVYDLYDGPYNDDWADQTTPFIQQTSTPHSYGGENIEMQTMQHESSGLPEKSYVETSFGGSKTSSETAWVSAKDLFPNMSSSELEVSYNTKGKLQVKMFGAGKKLYSLMTTERCTNREVINKSLPKEIKTALGPSKYERVQRITSDKRRELKESQDLAAQREKNKKDMEEKTEALEKAKKDVEDLGNADLASERDIEKAKAKVRTLEAEKVKARSNYFKSVEAEGNKHSIEEDISVLEDLQEEDLVQEEQSFASESLKVIRKRKEAIDWRKKIELDKVLDRDADPETRELAQNKYSELDKSYQQLVSEEKTLQQILGEKQSLTNEKKEQLKKDKQELEKQNKEDREIINDRDADPEEIRRAGERVAFRQAEIRQINTQLEEGGESLSEKVKEIFKKYGLTLTAIFLAAGVTIGAVIGVITNALKAMGKQIANGLKTLGQKAAAALPGLIGSIVSFLFKTAGKVFGFLAEHTWLLILAVVAFVVDKYLKKQR